MIRSIHPFYILGFMLMLLITLVWKNSQIQNDISVELSNRTKNAVLAKRIIGLKKVMKTADKNQIDRFLDAPLYADSELTHRVKNKRYIINAKSMSARQLQAILNRILNLSVKVMQLKIEPQGEQHASLYMEISL